MNEIGAKRIALRPWHLLLSPLILSFAGGGILTALTLRRWGKQRGARKMKLIIIFILLPGLALLGLLTLKWYFTALILLGANIISGLVYYFIGRRAAGARAILEARGRGAQVFTGIVGGLALGLCLGGLFGILYLLLTDALFSTVVPINMGRFFTILFFLLIVLRLSLVGGVVGGILGRWTPQLNLRQTLKVALCLSWATGVCLLFYLCFFLIPTFQIYGVVKPFSSRFLSQFIIWILTSLVVTVGTLYMSGAAKWRGLLRRGFLVLTIAFCLNLTLVHYWGLLSYDFLILGKYLEKKVNLKWAQCCYERSLLTRSNDAVSSYLQFRIGLLHHKLGMEEMSQSAFEKVVTKYTDKKDLVSKSQSFLDKMKKAPLEARRVVIPGVETRTEYKIGYCVPNSVSLILRYWGIATSPKEIGQKITMADMGTFLPEQVRFVKAQNLEHFLIPMSGLEDIKRYVDLNIPVLVYVPHHVFAIFGYDEKLKTLITYDVAQWDIWVDYPIDDFLKEWRKEFSTLGLILPSDKLQLIPAGERKKMERVSQGYLHYLLHHLIEGRERTRMHLWRSMEAGADLFFAYAYMYVRWPEEREKLLSGVTLDSIRDVVNPFLKQELTEDTFGRGPGAELADFLQDYSRVMLDNGRYDELKRLLTDQKRRRELSSELLYHLGLLHCADGEYDQAIASLRRIGKEQKRYLPLGRAFERKGSDEAAVEEYSKLNTGGKKPSFGKPFFVDEETWRDIWKGGRGCQTPFLLRRLAVSRINELCHKLNDYETMKKQIENFVRDFPLDAEMQYQYAVALQHAEPGSEEERTKNREKMLRALRFAISLDKEGTIAREAQRLLKELTP